MPGFLIGLSALAFGAFFIYHSRLDAAIRAHINEGEGDVTVRLYLLGGALRLRLSARVFRGEEGHLRLEVLKDGKPLSVRKKTSSKAKKKKTGQPRFTFPAAARQYAVRRLDLSSLGLSLTVGVASDAAVTAQLCGLALTVLESAACVVRALKPRARVLMRAAPHYAKDCLRARFSCIAGIKIGHLIHVAALIAAYYAKGALKKWLIQLKTLCVPPWKTSKI